MKRVLGFLLLGVALLAVGWWMNRDTLPGLRLYISALERSTFPAQLGNASGLGLYVRCQLDERCRPALAHYAELHPLPAPQPWGYLPAVLLAVTGLILTAPSQRRPLYDADYATPAAYPDMLTRFPSRDGQSLLLAAVGRTGRRYLAIRPGLRGRRELGHVLVYAPTRSGKTAALIANLLNWTGSVVVLDIKGELHALTSGHRAQFGPVLVLDPGGVGDTYDPFMDFASTDEGLMSAARSTARAESDRNPVFAERMARGFAAAVRAAQVAGRPVLAYVAEALESKGPLEFVQFLLQTDDPTVRRHLAAFVGLSLIGLTESVLANDRFFMSSWSLLQNRLASLLTSGVVRMTGRSDFQAADLVRQPTTVYLRFPETTWESTRDVFQLIMTGLVHGLMREADNHPGRPGVPLLLAIDEAGRTPIPRLPDFMATISGRGISALLYLQSRAQLITCYGPEGAQAIEDNAHHQVYYPARSLGTMQHVSALAGRRSSPDIRTSQQLGGLLAREDSRSVGERDRPLLTPDDVRRLPADTVLVLSDDRPLIRARRVLYFRDARMRRLIEVSERHPTPVHPIPDPSDSDSSAQPFEPSPRPGGYIDLE